jgi:hypothetical protein
MGPNCERESNRDDDADDYPCEGDRCDCDDDDCTCERDYRDRGCFADPGGKSALRAASKSNPRNLPCPRCHAKNVLTPADRARSYVCDACADRAERGCD